MNADSNKGLAGTTFDGLYTLQRTLGRGGFATVWEAKVIATDRRVALKIFHAVSMSDRRMERARAEAELLLRLGHPSIGRAEMIRLEHNPPYLVLELIEGEPLHSVIRQHCGAGSHFTLPEIRSVMSQLCAAIAFAAEQGVVHRDLKPQNIMCAGASKDEVKVIDFGIARLLDLDADRATTQGRVLGSVFYMSPEQARGEPVDTRTDVFAAGSILFELLTLRRAWAFGQDGDRAIAYSRPLSRVAKNNPLQVLDETSGGRRPVPSQYRSSLPEAVDRVVARATAADPAERYASAAELWTELDLALPAVDDIERLSVEDQALTQLATRIAVRGELLEATPLPHFAPTATAAVAPTITLPGSSSFDAPPFETPVPSMSAPLRPSARGARLAMMLAGLLLLGLVAIGVRISMRGLPANTAAKSSDRVEAVTPAPTAIVQATAASTVTEAAESDPPSAPSEEPAPSAPTPVERAPSSAMRPPVVGRAKTKTPVTAKPDRAPLRALLDRARSDPNDVEAIKMLRRGILGAAAKLPEGAGRRRIRRVTESSAMLGDVEGLARALAELESSEASQ